MTEAETVRLFAVINAFYPRFLQDANRSAAVKAWALMFADDDYRLAEIAVKAFVATDTKGFPPVIGQIKEQMQKLREGNRDSTEMSAWALVSKALHNGLYGYREEYAKLPKDVQDAIGGAEQLRDWAMMDSSELQTVVASNFMRSYRARAQYVHEQEKLPADIRQMLAEVQKRLAFKPRLEKPNDELLNRERG